MKAGFLRVPRRLRWAGVTLILVVAASMLLVSTTETGQNLWHPVAAWLDTDEVSKANKELNGIHARARTRRDLDAREVAALARYLSSTQAVFREMAVALAADAKSDSSRRAIQPKVLERLHDPSPDVRREAITTLDSFGDTNVLPKLEPLLRDPDPGVASEARIAFDSFGQKTAGIGLSVARQGPNLVVVAIYPESPAALNGTIHTGDRLIAVGQSNQPPVDVKAFSVEQVVRLLRGPKGTAVTVTEVGRDGSDFRVVSFIRAEFMK